MTVDEASYSRFLEAIAADIDIPPSKYQDAVDRYKSVGRWLEDGQYPGSWGQLNVYPQGSFRLGTVTKPITGSPNAGYDIDLVAQLPILMSETDPRSVKAMIGDRLREHRTYAEMLDDEGKRCWTILYAEEDGVGFHVDVLPCVPAGRGSQDTSIAITSRKRAMYEWLSSNPIGYGQWFDDRNQGAFERVVEDQKRVIQGRVPEIYARIGDVPDQLVRTPLQRSIQLMKRHRDVMFNDAELKESAPISIIITTLAAYFYDGEPDLYAALARIVSKLRAHAVLVDDGVLDPSIVPDSPIKRTSDSKWYFANPVDPLENFADRWHEDGHRRARAFFAWVDCAHSDLIGVPFSSASAMSSNLSQALATPAALRNIDLIAPASPTIEGAPRVHISSAAKPWGQ